MEAFIVDDPQVYIVITNSIIFINIFIISLFFIIKVRYVIHIISFSYFKSLF